MIKRSLYFIFVLLYNSTCLPESFEEETNFLGVICAFEKALDSNLVCFVLIFSETFSSNNEKWGLFYSHFKPVSATYVTEILKAFWGFTSTLNLKDKGQDLQTSSCKRCNVYMKEKTPLSN